MTSRLNPLSALLAAGLVLASVQPAAARTAAVAHAHPLDPLSDDEIKRSIVLFRADSRFPKDGIFPILDLLEPSKEEVLAWKPGTAMPRRVQAVVYSRSQRTTHEGEADLVTGKITRWEARPGVQPMIMMEEYAIARDTVRADKRWQEAMRKRGITNFTEVGVDGWAAGPAFGSAKRVMRALSFYKGGDKFKNYYNRPIEGVVALVDLDTQEVLEVTDTGVTELAPRGYEFDPASTKGKREPLKPLVISQPQGASFKVQGQQVRWQGWNFRFSMHARDGLVLHQVGFEEGGKVRSILYRAGISEMIVPYGDPDPNWNWRTAFDVGEYGFGNLSSPLDPGGDVPATATLFGAIFVDPQGKPYKFSRAVAIYERDGGVLWKHYDFVSNENNVRRARQLVVTTAATVGNYDYLINWIFHQDGTLEMDADATGILLVKGTNRTQGEAQACPGCESHLVDSKILAPNHQHFFSWRLDFDVDGTQNELFEMNQRPMGESSKNPNGNGFIMLETPLGTEAEAQRDLSPESNRRWRVVNPKVTNRLGNASGYMLMPGENTPAYVTQNSPARKRAAFLNHTIWATRFKPKEMYAAGDYPNQASADQGLSIWANDGEKIAGEDLVLWYTMGLSHAPREEEWPIMNSHHLGFKLMPNGFFASNPALDVPR